MRGFRIGRVFGIDLRVDWSWTFIFVLLTWNLVTVFSRWHPDWSAPGAFAVAAATTLAFFGCVLLHELAHSVVAVRFGMRVRSITLFLFGGVSDIEKEPPSAKAEFLMAIVGPITSIALGLIFVAFTAAVAPRSVSDVDGAMAAFARLGPMMTLVAWLGPINILIGVFNLIPGFPLDGGRVLRSILWSITGNLRTSTMWASMTGQAIGWLFIGCGIAMTFGARLPFFGTGLISGLWLAFIGWFLHGAAQRANTRLALDDVLVGMTVEQLMKKDGPVATPALSLESLVHDHLIAGEDRALPVVQDGTLVGLVSVSDVRNVPPAQWSATSVASVMQSAPSLTVASPGQPLATAFEQLAKENIDQLPVVADGKLVGMLRRRDVSRWLELAWKPADLAMNRPPKPAASSAPLQGGGFPPGRVHRSV
ncbi:MAG: site-2 protease family protein [Polyangiaceae bacterium]